MAQANTDTDSPRNGRLAALALGALGVVYGDIGTSPLYALRECFHGGIAVTEANVLGVLSLIVWSLILVISIKYIVFVMRADNHGEGGIIALMSLVRPRHGEGKTRSTWLLVAMGIFGAALLYGDGMITPAISVLSAVEGLEVATPVFEPYIIPITVVILIGLFALQPRGTGGIGKLFGPVTLIWFLTLALLGITQIVGNPAVFRAINPLWGVEFFARNGWTGFLVLGSVFLVVTGGETLYADMGHFGTRPIRLTWFALVLPALVLNYFGQGALLLENPAAVENPFYLMAPEWALYPLVILATMATIIASQAVISGSFSLTRQAVQLGYSPRMEIRHTSEEEAGQIYIPAVNWTLMIATIGLVIGFQSSSALAAAYGVGVSTDFVFTTILLAAVAYKRWKWGLPLALLLAASFLWFDLSFMAATYTKIPEGGWFPLVIAAGVFALMSTWERGRDILARRIRKGALPLQIFLDDIKADPPTRVPGTAIYMYGGRQGTPPALVHNFTHNKVVHERVALLTVVTEDRPEVPPGDRVEVEDLGEGFFRILAHYGFVEDPNVPDILSRAKPDGEGFELADTTFFLGRETLISSDRPGMASWREKLFAFMSRNAQRATAFFDIPPDRVVELGAQVEL